MRDVAADAEKKPHTCGYCGGRVRWKLRTLKNGTTTRKWDKFCCPQCRWDLKRQSAADAGSKHHREFYRASCEAR